MSVSTTTVTVAPPVRAGAALATLHGAAGIAACFLPLPAAGLVLAGVIASAASLARACGLRGPTDLPAALHLLPDGTLLATDRNGVTVAGELVSGRHLGASLIAMAVRLQPMEDAVAPARRAARVIRLLLVAGDQSGHDLRALRVWLRWQRPARRDHRSDVPRADARSSRPDDFLKKCVAALNSLRESRSHRVDAAAGGRAVPGGATAPGPGGRGGTS